ncbi:UNVERIFIED_CONTAM: hypothetical protein Sangu_3249100 [Sesamum angustifolium]|uniref:Uncharacterized protein n=1 Tax=Sesamum angustifolium TaxID=2727405 RepID=A0AAW2JE33_9LAMI
MIAGPSQPNSSNAPTPSPRRHSRRVTTCVIGYRWDPDWPDHVVPQPPADAPALTTTTGMPPQMAMI